MSCLSYQIRKFENHWNNYVNGEKYTLVPIECFLLLNICFEKKWGLSIYHPMKEMTLVISGINYIRIIFKIKHHIHFLFTRMKKASSRITIQYIK